MVVREGCWSRGRRGVSVCLLTRAKLYKKRGNAVDDLRMTRKLYAVKYAKAI